MDQEKVIADLKHEFAQLKKEIAGKRGIPGPTGPAGSIDAAVNNAADVAERVATEAAKRAVVYPFQNEVAKLREEFEELKAHIDNAIIHHVVETLQAYGVLDANMNPLNKAHVESHLKTLGLLKN